MKEIFEILLNSQRANQVALDQAGRSPYPTLAVCVQNADDQNRRRIKVALPSNPSIQSDWVRRLDVTPYCDNPVVAIGQTVLIFYVDGLDTNMWYLPLTNDVNPPRDKEDPLKDCSREIPGNNELTIKGDDTKTVEGKITANGGDIEFNSEEDFKLEVKQNILMNALQALTLQAAQYVMLKAGVWFIKIFSTGVTEMGGGVLTIDCGGYGLNFVNVGTMNINSKAISVVGATDSDGDVLVDKGW
ncbi:hypothetical protein [Nostoc sp. UHCC 0870]|uniref:hypothetical protein n=1 Tax=Nostoc sp. UHCC 0870 TaxID=2914041 RepID=UPI001EE122F9|nr:hypothetical protein [Nostoc sp. UHCC 0870]UKO99357.1 hypothetical protein L6494_06490 [Nostoc sp. UHCC 0870]